ncbi:hypothetical protein TIFTF001_027987 [Ficus carica]|uniref:Uncharacterized protein n=1 Tax=Ficus carica TaxID=3494 RepID=A0AA88IVU3_FICCA|nr:hypothetical protein TIFTF001_027987 [Ficus carica]
MLSYNYAYLVLFSCMSSSSIDLTISTEILDSEKMDAAGNHDRRRTMERELTRHDMLNGVSIPSNWPLDELPFCVESGMIWIVLRDGVVPNKY